MCPICGAGSSRIPATARATSTAEIGEVLPPPIGSANSSEARTPAAASIRKKPSRKTVARTVTTGNPDQDRACSASQCSLCCGLLVVSLMLISVTVICDMFTKASTPWWRATAAVLIVASRCHAETDIPKKMRPHPSMARCIDARSVRSPCTTSAPSRRSSSARLSSRRTKARTLCPLASRNSVRLRPMPPTAPAAPVTRIGLSCLCFVVMSLTLGYIQKTNRRPRLASGFSCAAALARRQSGLPHDETLDRRDDDHQHRHDHDVAGCRGLQPAHGEIGLEAIIQGETDQRHAGRGDPAGDQGDRRSDQFRGKGHLPAPENGVIIYTTYKLYIVEAIGPMPRTADPELPHRILKAADALWQSGGEEAGTIRGVAAEAATTTPTVYSYYADREALLTALRALAFQRFSGCLAKSRDFQDACARD